MIEKRNKTQIIEEMKTHIENAYKLSLKPIVSFTNFKEFWELNTELGYNVGLFLLNKYFFQSLLGFYQILLGFTKACVGAINESQKCETLYKL